MPRRNKRKSNWRKLFLILLILILAGLPLVGWRLIGVSDSWSGNEQISLGIETAKQDSLLITVTPAKDMVVVVRIPSRTIIDTPWYGSYQVGKLSLLSEQEGNRDIYARSLSYYLGLPVDIGMMRTSLKVDDLSQSLLRKSLRNLLFPPRNITNWRLWRFLNKSNLVWQVIDLENYGQIEKLADGSEVYRIEPEKIDQRFWTYFSDPVIKEEGLTMSIFNVGEKSGLANKISSIPENIGIRVVEVAGLEAEIEGCVINLGNQDQENTYSVQRLGRILGCPVEFGVEEGFGDIELLIENVKI
jgi:hypothetical protein